MSVDDAKFVRLSKGLELVSHWQMCHSHRGDLPSTSRAARLQVLSFDFPRLVANTSSSTQQSLNSPVLPGLLPRFRRPAGAARRTLFKLRQTAHFKAEGTLEAVAAAYEKLSGDE